MQRRGLCCHVLARPGPAWPCVVCGPGLRLLLQAAVPSTRRLLRSRHAAPWAVLPRLGRGVRSWPAPALAGSGCRAISTPRSGSNGAASLMGQLQLASLKKASCMKPAHPKGRRLLRTTSSRHGFQGAGDCHPLGWGCGREAGVLPGRGEGARAPPGGGTQSCATAWSLPYSSRARGTHSGQIERWPLYPH